MLQALDHDHAFRTETAWRTPKIVIASKPDPPATSWWVDLSRPQFVAEIAKQLPRMQGAKEARYVDGLVR